MDRTAPVHALRKQTITLTIAERGSTTERHTLSDAEGAFVFANLPVGGIRAFVVETDYAGVHYESKRIMLSPDSPTGAVSLWVYDPLRDRSVIRETLAFAVMEIAPGAIRVGVVQRFENPTDRTVVATANDPLRFPLPPGAGAVTFLAGWQHPVVADGSITDAFPVLPGSAFVSYAYALAVRHPRLVVPWMFPDGAASVEILVEDVGPRVAGDGVHRIGIVTEKGRRYERWSGGPIPAGGRVAIVLDGLPVLNTTWPGIVAAALAIVLGGGLAGALRRRRSPSE